MTEVYTHQQPPGIDSVTVSVKDIINTKWFFFRFLFFQFNKFMYPKAEEATARRVVQNPALVKPSSWVYGGYNTKVMSTLMVLDQIPLHTLASHLLQ